MDKTTSAILLISAPDKEGLVFTITEYIFQNKGNILHAEQHIDPVNNIFFMRIEWDLSHFLIQKENILSSLQSIKKHWNMDLKLYFSDSLIKTAVFVSRDDHCLHDLLYKIKNSELAMDVQLIVSNHQDNETIAGYYQTPFYFFPMFRENKKEQEQAQMKLLTDHGVELIILARYMQILTPGFVRAYPQQIINVHHSFLPAFIGANPYKQAYDRGVKVLGSTAHYVTEALDDGPIIAQQVVNINHKDSLQNYIEKGKELEKQVLSFAIKKHIERKILVYQNKTVVFD
ncbi:MAG: formyltetrahydrofolate deformylase [Candidatus Margulisbacteria bacterium]|nr:formyltetrahydrofolate deformylase [Candidatus Margulisiibacteriota bacterium]